jgi:hypothetical protein
MHTHQEKPAPTRRAVAAPDGSGFRARLREFALAWMLGTAVVIWPGDGSLSRAPWSKPPAYERALRWRDIIRLRLSPWLLMHDSAPSPRDQAEPGSSSA